MRTFDSAAGQRSALWRGQVVPTQSYSPKLPVTDWQAETGSLEFKNQKPF